MKNLSLIWKILCVALIAMGAYVTVADAADCEDVRFLVKNSYKTSDGTPRTIKVVDIQYYDYDKSKWRNKFIKNTKIDPGNKWYVSAIGSASVYMEFKHVGGEKTKIKVYYKYYTTSWSSKKSKTSSSFKCSDNMVKTVTVK